MTSVTVPKWKMGKVEMRETWLDGTDRSFHQSEQRAERKDEMIKELFFPSVTTKTRSDSLKLLSRCQTTRFTMNWNPGTVQRTKRQSEYLLCWRRRTSQQNHR